MIYLLDTNTLSFAMAGDTAVCGRLLTEARNDVRLPQPVVAEIAYGLARMPASKKRARLTDRFRIFLDEMARDPWTDDVSHAFGRIKADLERRGVRIEDFDVSVAAHAVARNAILVSDNLEHLGRVDGLRLENWRDRTGP